MTNDHNIAQYSSNMLTLYYIVHSIELCNLIYFDDIMLMLFYSVLQTYQINHLKLLLLLLGNFTINKSIKLKDSIVFIWKFHLLTCFKLFKCCIINSSLNF